MTIQHRLIPDTELHEPKGVLGAGSHQVYVAGGTGSGTWKRIDSTDLSGLNGDSGSTNKVVKSNGGNGFNLKTANAYGVMAITSNTNGFAMTAAVDPNLNTNTDYVLYTGTGAPWASENLFGGTVFTTDRLVAPVTGIYRVSLWATITGYPSTAAKIGLKYRVNSTTFSTRNLISKSNAAGDYGIFTGFDTLQLNANDYIQLFLASSVTGSLVMKDANVTIDLIREL